jgi:hypothetical protein
MLFQAFCDLFPEIGYDETRNLHVLGENIFGLPSGTYRFEEFFCKDTGCDCRRVMFFITSANLKEMEAVITYGWESREFYARLMASDDEKEIAELQGPIVDISPEYFMLAPAFQLMFSAYMLRDHAYIERVKGHYCIFRAEIERRASLKGARDRKKKPPK